MSLKRPALRQPSLLILAVFIFSLSVSPTLVVAPDVQEGRAEETCYFYTREGSFIDLATGKIYAGNFLFVLGEVQNTGTVNIENVRMEFTFYDANDTEIEIPRNLLHWEVRPYTGYILAPGQRLPFEMVVLDEEALERMGTPITWSISTKFDETAEEPYRDLKILSHSGEVMERRRIEIGRGLYRDVPGFYRVLGEVQNTGNQYIEHCTVYAAFHDEEGKVRGVDADPIDVGILVPGQKSYFTIDLYYRTEYSEAIAQKVVEYELFAQCEVTDKIPYREFEILSHSSRVEDGVHIVSGEIQNTGDRNATDVRVVVTYYGSDGKVIGGGYGNTDPRNLEPGQVASFELSTTYPVANYTLQVRCKEYALKEPSTISCAPSKRTITVGEQIQVSGSISPPKEGVGVTLTYTKPDGTTARRTVTTDAEGSYIDSYTPDAVGSWRVEASWEGDVEHKGATSPSVSFEVKKRGCIIATATYGSELAPEVQFLRGFRDGTVLSTFAGSQFMAAFNAWYYSFSPPIASYLSNHEMAKGIMRVALYPLIGILRLSASTYSALGFSPELSVVVAGFVASSLIGIVYLSPPIIVLQTSVKRLRRLRTGQLRCFIFAWLITVMLILTAEILASPVIMIGGTASFVLLNLALSALMVSNQIVKQIDKV